MRQHLNALHWYRILVGIYMGLNLLLTILSIAFPLVVVGPGFPFSASQLWALMLTFYLIKTLSSFLLLEGERRKIIILLLALSCLWETWLVSPFFWGNLNSGLLLLDWTVMISTIYVFWKRR